MSSEEAGRDNGMVPAVAHRALSTRSKAMAQRGLELAKTLKKMGGTGVIVTVFGAKGGIGKTIVATNLAVALAQQTGKRVALADLGMRFGDVAIYLDLSVARGIADLALPEHQLDGDMLQSCLYTHSTGVTVLPTRGSNKDWRNIRSEHIERIVTLLSQTNDFILLDTESFNDIVVTAIHRASNLVLVTTGSQTVLKETLLAIDLLRSWNFDMSKITLVLVAVNEGSAVDPEEVERILGLKVACSLPYERNLSTAMLQGTPLVASHPDSPAARIIVQLARLLCNEQAR